MSESLPENSFGGVLRVVKLTSGEEIIGMVNEAYPDRISIKLPARVETYVVRDEKSELIEYVKLTNYLSNIRGYEISLSRNVIVYMGSPTLELEKMYEVFFMTMQTDSKTTIAPMPDDMKFGHEAGLQMLNDLFTNEDFVNFVNDLIDNFEGAEILLDEELDAGNEESEPECPPFEELKEEAPKPPKPKKRRTMNPEPKKLPYNPEGDPNKAESWPDDPSQYFN
jgi:hypothetical protein